jgi:hypothetical protein
MNLRRALALSLLMALSFSCDKDHLLDCTKGTGPVITVKRFVAGFSKIYLSDNVDVRLHHGTDWSVKVTAGQLLVDGIITELQGNKLYIRNENRCNWVRSFSNKYTVDIIVPDLDYINYSGSGNITCLDSLIHKGFTLDSWNGSGNLNLLLNTTESHVNIHLGRCTINAEGYSGVSYIYLNDVGVVNANLLRTGYTFIRNSSTGNAKVNVSQELTAELEHTGNVYYSGNPNSVHETHSGSGRLIKQ